MALPSVHAKSAAKPEFIVEFQHALRDDRELSSIAKLVAYSLAARWPYIHPSVATLVADTGLCKNTVLKALRELADKGWLEITPQQTPQGDPGSNLYTLRVPVGVVHQMNHRSAPDAPGVVHQMHPKSQSQESSKNQKSVSLRFDKKKALELALRVHGDVSPEAVRAAVDSTNWDRIKNPEAYIRSAKFARALPAAASWQPDDALTEVPVTAGLKLAEDEFDHELEHGTDDVSDFDSAL